MDDGAGYTALQRNCTHFSIFLQYILHTIVFSIIGITIMTIRRLASICDRRLSWREGLQIESGIELVLVHAREEPVRHSDSIGVPFESKQLLHLCVLRLGSADTHRERPGPPKHQKHDSRSRSPQRSTFRQPTTIRQVGESDAGDEEHRAGVGRVTNDVVWSVGDEFVFRMDG